MAKSKRIEPTSGIRLNITSKQLEACIERHKIGLASLIVSNQEAVGSGNIMNAVATLDFLATAVPTDPESEVEFFEEPTRDHRPIEGE